MAIIENVRKIQHVIRTRSIPPTPQEFFFLTFAITYLCNSKCTMCNIWQKYKKTPNKYKEELNANEIRNAFAKSDIFKKIQILLIGGGEPFLKKDFVDIILAFNEFKPEVPIIIASNGQIPELIEAKLVNIRQELMRRGNQNSVMFVGVSLDGMEETHDRMRGVKDSFKKAKKTLEILKSIDGINTGFVFTFTPQNYREFKPVLHLAKEMKTALTFQFAQTSVHYYDNSDVHFDWNQKQIDEVRNILHETRFFDVIRKGFFDYGSSQSFKDHLLSYNRFFLDYVLDYQLHPERHFDCFSGTHSCFLDPYGNVYPCISLEKSMGNIREQNFDILWTSIQAKQTREYISQRHCHCCSFCDIPNSLPRNWSVISSNLKNKLVSR